MSQHELIQFIDTSAPRKKVDLMFKINEERGSIPKVFFSLLRHKEALSPDRVTDLSGAIEAMGFESQSMFLDFIKPVLE